MLQHSNSKINPPLVPPEPARENGVENVEGIFTRLVVVRKCIPRGAVTMSAQLRIIRHAPPRTRAVCDPRTGLILGAMSEDPAPKRQRNQVTLRNFLSDGHQKVFRESDHSIADIPISEVSMARIQAIYTQLVAHEAVSEALRPFADPHSGSCMPPPSLHDAIQRAKDFEIINGKQAGVLESINRAGNAAKHEMPERPAQQRRLADEDG